MSDEPATSRRSGAPCPPNSRGSESAQREWPSERETKGAAHRRDTRWRTGAKKDREGANGGREEGRVRDEEVCGDEGGQSNERERKKGRDAEAGKGKDCEKQRVSEL
eukprot:2647277-Pleurochrysis_carterae.AAC.2